MLVRMPYVNQSRISQRINQYIDLSIDLLSLILSIYIISYINVCIEKDLLQKNQRYISAE